MPLVRGRAPTSSARLTPSKIGLGVVADLDAGEGRERAVVELHDHALERLERRLISSSRSWTGVSGPSRAPLAMRKSRL